jgi:hypothetical protein
MYQIRCASHRGCRRISGSRYHFPHHRAPPCSDFLAIVTDDHPPLIDPSHAAFIQSGVSMCVAACDHEHMPVVARATGCRVAEDRREVTIYLPVAQAEPLLRCARASGAVAAVFNEPVSHRTVQLKGENARIIALQDDDRRRIAAYRDAFVRAVAPLGFHADLIHTVLGDPSADMVALRFTPSAAFSQTPGPQAGEPLRAAP